MNINASSAMTASVSPTANVPKKQAEAWWRTVKKVAVKNWLKLCKYVKSAAVEVKEFCKRFCKNLFLITPILPHTDEITALKALADNKESCLRFCNSALGLAKNQHEYHSKRKKVLLEKSNELEQQLLKIKAENNIPATEQLNRTCSIISKKTTEADNERNSAAKLVKQLTEIATNLSQSIAVDEKKIQGLSV